MGKHRKKKEKKGLRVDVRGNNVEWALKKLKRMVKDSEMILELDTKYENKVLELFMANRINVRG